MSKQRIAILVCCVIGVLGTFLPWYHLPIVGAVLGTGDRGWITASALAGAILPTVLGQRERPLRIGPRAAVVVLCAFVASVAIYKIVDFQHHTGELSAGLFGSSGLGSPGSALMTESLGDKKMSDFAKALDDMLSMTMQVGVGLYIVAATALGGLVLALAPFRGRRCPVEPDSIDEPSASPTRPDGLGPDPAPPGS